MFYEVGYDVGDGIFSVNVIEGGETLAKLYAEGHAKRYGYRVAYMNPISEVEAKSRKMKGMPIIDAFKFFSEKN